MCDYSFKTMSFRALALLMLFLLFHAGQAVAVVTANPCKQQLESTCGMGCCEAILPGEGGQCCQVENTPSNENPAEPSTPLPAGGQQSQLKTVWTLQQTFFDVAAAPRLPELMSGTTEWQEQPRLLLTVPLTVLHCAFLT